MECCAPLLWKLPTPILFNCYQLCVCSTFPPNWSCSEKSSNLLTISLLLVILPWDWCFCWRQICSLEMISLWSVQHSVPHIAFVSLTSCLSLLLTITECIRCQCLLQGCIHKVLLGLGKRKKVLVLGRSWDAQVLMVSDHCCCCFQHYSPGFSAISLSLL